MSWDKPLKLHELGRGVLQVRLEPDELARAVVAKTLGLESLSVLKADLTVKAWLDGVEVTGRFRAVVEQVCGISLDPFEQEIEGQIEVHAVPAGSPHAAAAEGGELELDPDAPDAPDVLASDAVDLAAYVVEHLALELDPFPRKPGVEFEYQPPEVETSPFAALKKLTEPKA
ncbi:DUF177 domain-containing protein [Phenylobacterium sp.]|uniref:YceD family protein n=1 Tax=Phenylobacterium sp. TaxID=1871053 RepID=UPI0025ED891E|nr:DUF177 domain-containing protein [Phenylobacterium sp.]